MAKAKKSKVPDTTIVRNKKALHDYFVEDTFEAGIALEGWEVKSLREGKVQLVDSYVILKDGEASIIGCRINPLNSASTCGCRPGSHPQAAIAQKGAGTDVLQRAAKRSHLHRHQALLEGTPGQVSGSAGKR